ncbi:I78 family peptidase inhibitor [Novosphingobium sp. SL115]|uniref:I78 family peptidase inhibitor n=1 Tax=Novosphingobium sp. SL115 TaxID=2995150 RepID=UPI0022750AD7|nr:I78 family peptidase inhibitor [Novosphingobium sp. SL115]MCY1671506.1 I78 family peptidase inhibitor [Novosphingobium sp. SL115]
MLKASLGVALLCSAYAMAPATAAAVGLQMTRTPSPPGVPGAAPPLSASPQQPDTCGLLRARRLIGSPGDAQARVRVTQTIGHPRLRWITPGAAITHDYRADRLNLILDDQGMIRTVRCG